MFALLGRLRPAGPVIDSVKKQRLNQSGPDKGQLFEPAPTKEAPGMLGCIHL